MAKRWIPPGALAVLAVLAVKIECHTVWIEEFWEVSVMFCGFSPSTLPIQLALIETTETHY